MSLVSSVLLPCAVCAVVSGAFAIVHSWRSMREREDAEFKARISALEAEVRRTGRQSAEDVSLLREEARRAFYEGARHLDDLEKAVSGDRGEGRPGV